jgi:hypothetical protein
MKIDSSIPHGFFGWDCHVSSLRREKFDSAAWHGLECSPFSNTLRPKFPQIFCESGGRSHPDPSCRRCMSRRSGDALEGDELQSGGILRKKPVTARCQELPADFTRSLPVLHRRVATGCDRSKMTRIKMLSREQKGHPGGSAGQRTWRSPRRSPEAATTLWNEPRRPEKSAPSRGLTCRYSDVSCVWEIAFIRVMFWP